MANQERLRPDQLRSHRYLGPDDLRSFGHRSRQKQAGFSTEDFAGKPVIGSRIGGIPELIEEGRTGWLVEPGDVDALVATEATTPSGERHWAASQG